MVALDPQLQRMIDAIDAKIAKLQQTKEILLSEFAETRFQIGEAKPGGQIPLASAPVDVGLAGTRKDQIKAFLRLRGPSKRQQIIDGTGIPVGTVAYVLNGDEFEHDSLGNWFMKSVHG